MKSLKLGFLSICFLTLTGFYGCLNRSVSKLNSGTTGGDGNLIGYVDTRSGTGGLIWSSGHTSPAASWPFGTVKLGPDTSTVHEMTASSGYHYGDFEIRGFSHSRYSGTGLKEGGILRVTPINGSITYDQVKNQNLLFDHRNEVATPGYYSVTILRNGQNPQGNKEIKELTAELTSTQHVGIHRYTYSEQYPHPHLLIDLTSHLSKGGNVKDVKAQVDLKNNLISGQLILYDDVSNRYHGLPIYFVIKSEKSFSHRFIRSTGEESTNLTIEGRNGEKLFVDLAYDSKTTEIPFSPNKEKSMGLYVGISYVSSKGAMDNLNSEVLQYRHRSFEDFQKEAERKWEEVLSRIRVQGPDEKLKQIFYASLYRSFLMPTIVSDRSPESNGSKTLFLGFDKKTHEQDASSFNYYSDFSLWDTFRTVHPLYNLIARNEQSDMIKSLVIMGEQSGRMPRWSGVAGHGDSMLGLPANITIAESVQKGIPISKEVKEAAFKLMLQSSSPSNSPMQSREQWPDLEGNKGRECMDEYIQYGFCPSNIKTGSVSYTLEYSYSDYAIAQMARQMGQEDIADQYQRRSQNYRNTWDVNQLAFVPINTNSTFESSFNLNDTSYVNSTKSAHHYFEGSPNQWRWYVPYDPEGLMQLFDTSGDSDRGRQRFVDALNDFFLNASPQRGSSYPGPDYWHGNEPDIHSAYLFNFAGRPDLTQKWVRWIMENKYSNDAQALDGDDDAGTLSAWYVLSSLGIFPMAGTTRYAIGSPLFAQTSFYLGDHLVQIEVNNFSPQNIYVESVRINGQTLPHPWFEHSQIAEGAQIVFNMSSQPVSWNGGEK